MVNNKMVDIAGLQRYHENLNAFLTTKQDIISDIDAIRSGASLGATALQSVPDEYAKVDDVESMIVNAIIVAINTEY